MKEHHDGKTDDNNREKKNIDEIPIDEVFRRNQIIISIYGNISLHIDLPAKDRFSFRFIQLMTGNMLILEINNANKNFFD